MSDETRRRALTAFRQQNPGPETTYSVDGLEVVVTGNGSEPTTVRLESGAFIALSGVPIYKRTMGSRAADAILNDLIGNTLEEGELGGAFAAICWDGHRARVFTDWLGNVCAYCNEAQTVWSTSFLTVAAASPRLTLDRQGAFEYLFQGAACGDSTVVTQVRRLDPEKWHDPFSGAESQRVSQLSEREFNEAEFDELVDCAIHGLDGVFDTICSEYQDHIDTALSGGYDSRLILAALRARGVKPRVHVYGKPGDADVQIATSIAKSERFEIEHVDKSAIVESLDGMGIAEIVSRNFVAFDGLPPSGIFEGGADLATRRSRMAEGHLTLNGGGGEVFRNYFYLLDRRYTIDDLMGAFYSRFDPTLCAASFNSTEYLRSLTRKVLAVLKVTASDFRRIDIERAYPLFRCRFWMAHNTSTNNLMGRALTPLVHVPAIAQALRVPIRLKTHGRLEAAMIKKLDPRLAKYRSDTRRSMSGEETTKEKLRDYATLLRPIWLRRTSYRIQHQFTSPPIYADWMQNFGSPIAREWSLVRELIVPERVRDAEVLNRAATLEFFGRRLGVERYLA